MSSFHQPAFGRRRSSLWADNYASVYDYQAQPRAYFQPRGLSGLNSGSPGPWTTAAIPQLAYNDGAFLNAQLAGYGAYTTSSSGTCADDSPMPTPCAAPAPMSCDVPNINYQVSVPRHTFQRHTQPMTWVTETVDLMPVQAMQAMAADVMHTPVCKGTMKAPSQPQWTAQPRARQPSAWLNPSYIQDYN